MLNFAADIPSSLRDTDDLLTRYGRWASASGGRRTCGSAEGAYRPEGWQAVERRRDVPEPLMPTPDALICQRALARVPDRERIVLAVLYVPQRLPPHVQFRLLRIPPRLCQQRHLIGLKMFANLHRLLCYSRAIPLTTDVSVSAA